MSDSNFGSQVEDVEAIDRYMRTTPLKTPEAFQIKDAYIKWYDASGFWDRNWSEDFYDEIRTRRNQLDIANQPTEAGKNQIRTTIAQGVSSEEMQGKKAPPIDPNTGRVGSQVKKPTAPATVSTMPTPDQAQGPILIDPNKTYATIRKGSSGADVKLWQTVLGVTSDGKFGPATETATKKWQTDHHLTADGVVGKNTWAAAGTAPASVPSAQPVASAPSLFAPTPAQAPSHPVFTPSSSTAPQTHFAPTTTTHVATTAKPAAKPAATKPVAKAVAKAKETTKRAAIQTASMLDVSHWPTWGKVAAGVTLAGSIAMAFMGKHGKHLFKVS